MNKYFICLANSYKRGGRCIAGVEIVSDNKGGWKSVHNENGRPRWIRPIAKTTYGEIPNYVAESIELLSVVKLTDVIPCPDGAHVENVYYSHIEQCDCDISKESGIMSQFIDSEHQSIFNNRGRAVSAEMFTRINYSLMFIHPEKASAYYDENHDKSKNRMMFTYCGVEYDFPITDPAFLDEFRNNPNRFAKLSNVYLTLSLGLEFGGWHHKLVAGVIIPTDSMHTNDVDGVSYMEQQKQIHRNAYEKWTINDDERLRNLYVEEDVSIQDLCNIFGRNEGAIRSRICKLGLDDDISTSFDNRTHNSRISQLNHQNWFDEYERELARLLDEKNEIEEQINEIRAKIQQGMELYGLDTIHSEQFVVTYTPAKTVIQFDSPTFRIENEELYASYCKPKHREAFIVVKRKVKE